jgi:ABC-type uncharacterized transport system involved in gliding motility auxiliary subunit
MYFTRIERYPFWPSVLDTGGNPGHPLTANFAGVDLFWTAEITPTAPAEGEEDASPPAVEMTALFHSTPEAWLQTRNFFLDPGNPGMYMAEREATLGEKTLGLALSGAFPSWFAGKDKPVREGSEQVLPDMPVEARPGRLIVVGNSAFVSNMLQAVGSQRNLDFFVHAADWLGNDEDIISIRNRTAGTGHLDKITDQEKRQGAFAKARMVNLVVMPLLVIAFGVGFALLRARRNREEGKDGL